MYKSKAESEVYRLEEFEEILAGMQRARNIVGNL